MEILLKSSAVLVSASLLAILLRKTSPETALLLSLTAITVTLTAACRLAQGFVDYLDTVRHAFDGLELIMSSVLKCLAISIITRIASDLCKDASQSAAASALEFIGTVCALGLSMPLLTSIIKTIGGLL